MQTYIALLRGINVGGHNKIKMADLKSLFEKEGFKNTTTYIQSGNVIFQSKLTSISKIEEKIKQVIFEDFNFHINVLIKTKEEILVAFKNNPFLKNKNVDLKKLHITFLKQTPTNQNINNLKLINLTNNDAFDIIGNSMYIYCPISFAKTKLNNKLIEKKLQTTATTRNWNTITKLVELSSIE